MCASIALVSVPDDIELADLLEALLQRAVCSQAESDLHSMVETDLTMSQFRCLVALGRDGHAIPIHELAERLHLSLPTAGRNIDRLVAQELVNRREDPHDRRVRRVSLSAKGLEVISGIDEAGRNALLAFVRTLPPLDRSRLHAALVPIINSTSTPMPHLKEQTA
jgi:DNA-binding MarR family transcriptional regulator